MSVRHLFQDLNAEDVVQSDSTLLEPMYCGLIISAPGTVTFLNGRGESCSFVVGATSVEPVYLWGQITKVMDTGTTVADANLTGLRVGGQTAHVHE